MKTFVLSEDTVKKVVSLQETIVAVESAFKMKGLGKTQMPSKQYLFMKKHNGDLRTMPAYLEETDVAVVKVVNSHPDNPKKFGLPTVMATIILVDPKTGAPKAIMGGAWITALRTGAAGAIAAKYLANPNPKTVGLVGAGMQAKTQLMGLLQVFRTLEEVKVWDINEQAAVNYAKEMNTNEHVNVCAVKNTKNVVQDADIVVTVTPSRKPLVSADWVHDGTHINCIGADAPGKQELDPAVLVKSKIVVDDIEQSCHGGEINVPITQGLLKPEDIWGDICEIVAGLKLGRTSTEEITVFTSTGLAIQDAATADVVYQKALKQKIGETIQLM
ncbi:MAG: alanine dehydrogenase [Candidatus Bathyarchaeia archaeon]